MMDNDYDAECIPQALDKIISSSSCKGAVKFGDELSQEDAARILKGLEHCEFPFKCVHGRNSIKCLPLEGILAYE